MKKKIRKITPKEALDFIDAFQKMKANQDEKTKMISLRIPENILRAYKIKAKAEEKPYQTLIISTLRRGLAENK